MVVDQLILVHQSRHLRSFSASSISFAQSLVILTRFSVPRLGLVRSLRRSLLQNLFALRTAGEVKVPVWLEVVVVGMVAFIAWWVRVVKSSHVVGGSSEISLSRW